MRIDDAKGALGPMMSKAPAAEDAKHGKQIKHARLYPVHPGWVNNSASETGLFFLSFFNLTDVVVFGVLGGLFGYLRPAKSWRWGLWLSIPTILLCLALVRRLGSVNLLQGTGTGWALSALIIPLAGCLGSYLGARLASGRRLP